MEVNDSLETRSKEEQKTETKVVFCVHKTKEKTNELDFPRCHIIHCLSVLDCSELSIVLYITCKLFYCMLCIII